MVKDENALNAQEVADILQVSRNTVYNLVKGGALTAYNVGRKMRFTMKDVDAYIAHARNASTESVAAGDVADSSALPSRRTEEYTPFRIAGNDMAADVVANYLGGAGLPMQRIYENSYRALAHMYRNGVEAAIVHLYDHKTGQHNVPYVQRIVPGTPLIVIHLVRRRQGFLVAKGNPKNLRTWSDLLRDDVVMANRERGAGSRILLDEQLMALEAGSLHPRGYDREFTSTLALGAFIANGGADVGLGSERVFHQVDGLAFIPLHEEQLDLVLLKTARTQPAVKFLRQVLSGAGFKSEMGNIVGYDARNAGLVAYEV